MLCFKYSSHYWNNYFIIKIRSESCYARARLYHLNYLPMCNKKA